MTSRLNFLGQQHILTQDPDKKNKYDKEINLTHQNLDSLINEIAVNLKKSKNKNRYTDFNQKWDSYWAVYSQAILYSQANNDVDSQKWLTDANKEYEEFRSLYLQPLVRDLYKTYTQLLKTESRNFLDVLWTGISLLIVSLVGFISTFYYLQKVLKESTLLRSRFEFLAFHDELTGLPNRRMFQQKVIETLNESPHEFALMYMDMDKFKYVNDYFGHDVGDLVIQAFAKRIEDCIRETDILARQGGDEFTALLKDINEKEIIEVANKIIHSFEQPISIDGQAFHISTSIGIASYSKNGKEYLILLKNADDALYEAKEERNTYKISNILAE